MDKIKFSSLFWIVAIIHLITWTILPIFIRHGLNPDFTEAVIWGQQFSWGYDKNPWLPGMLAHLGILMGGNSGIGIYFIQSCFILLGMWSIFRLTTLASNPAYGLIAALMLEASASYTVDLQLFNDNYILMGLIPFISLLFFHILKEDRWRDWLQASAMLAIATMGKYDAILLGVSFFIFLLLQPNRKKYFVSYKMLSALILFIALCLPNLIWLFKHNFITLTYAFHERGLVGQLAWMEIFVNNIDFIATIGLGFLPPLFLMWLASSKPSSALSIQKEEKSFLFWIGIGPLLILLFLGFFMGIWLYREWGTTFMGLWGGYLLLFFKPSISPAAIKRFMMGVISFLVIWPVGYYYLSIKNDTGSYPAKEIATLASQVWHQHFNTPLYYVAGDRYVAGPVALHAVDKPSVWMEWNSAVSPWINVNDLKCKGALFIQDSGFSDQQFFWGMVFPDFVLKSFPDLKILSPIPIKWHRNHRKRPDLHILIGLLPPEKTCS